MVFLFILKSHYFIMKVEFVCKDSILLQNLNIFLGILKLIIFCQIN